MNKIDNESGWDIEPMVVDPYVEEMIKKNIASVNAGKSDDVLKLSSNSDEPSARYFRGDQPNIKEEYFSSSSVKEVTQSIPSQTGSWFGRKISQVANNLYDNPITRAVGKLVRGIYSSLPSWSSPSKKTESLTKVGSSTIIDSEGYAIFEKTITKVHQSAYERVEEEGGRSPARYYSNKKIQESEIDENYVPVTQETGLE